MTAAFLLALCVALAGRLLARRSAPSPRASFPLALALGAGSQMLQPLAIAVIGGLSISMALSLIVTPVIYFLLTRGNAPQPA